jgi:hypothetical protein
MAWTSNISTCVFEGIYVLDVSNLLEDLLYTDIPPSFMFTTHETILTEYNIQILLWIHRKKKRLCHERLHLKKIFLWNITKRCNVNVSTNGNTFW